MRMFLGLLAVLFAVTPAVAQSSPPAAVKPADTLMLTVFLKHDQSMTVEEIQQLQEKQGFYKSFPPAGVRIVSWHVLMGIGQVVTLELPASKLRDVNMALEKTAWKAFRTEFYPTYDLYPVVQDRLTNKARAQ